MIFIVIFIVNYKVLSRDQYIILWISIYYNWIGSLFSSPRPTSYYFLNEKCRDPNVTDFIVTSGDELFFKRI